jgi:hypothetical protein
MTAGELLAVINTKKPKEQQQAIDYSELLQDLRNAKNEYSRHTIS